MRTKSPVSPASRTVTLSAFILVFDYEKTPGSGFVCQRSCDCDEAGAGARLDDFHPHGCGCYSPLIWDCSRGFNVSEVGFVAT